ncbi:hypothetical protein [Mucilaginibacter sp.]|uniref:hypothetical protein n=1 Tax=Mucilaginibacter sp. TaxID=1882438 RepID=UPI0026322048|nr:hypothetical protein [Mucilaginibacter sp.]MDB4922248.1 hypothetical protein [Mucilaginibacter sp.]
MINPWQLRLIKNDGTKRNIIIEPILEKGNQGLHNTGTYKLYKDALGDESVLFTEPLEATELNNELPDNMNPDYLGRIEFDTRLNWTYKGDLLTLEEQKQAAMHILKNK